MIAQNKAGGRGIQASTIALGKADAVA
jgi:hypothetical protein